MTAVANGGESTVTFCGLGLKLDKAEDSDAIVSEIRKNQGMSVLSLGGNTLGVAAAKPIGSALCKCSSLKRCILNDLFTGRLKTEIAPALQHLSAGIIASGAKLVELDLSDNAFGPNGVVGVVELLASPACFTLQILRMNNQGLGHDGCRYLTKALQDGREACRKRGLLLKVFSGGRNRLENVGIQMLSEVLADMGTLEEISLYQNGIGIHGVDGVYSLVNILKRNRNLRLVNISDNNITPKGGEAIAKALRTLENLEELYLNDCILRSTGCQSLSSVLGDPDVTPNLRVLNLTGNEINRSAAISLILSLGSKTRLEALDLNANEFGKAGIQAILSTLESVGLSHTLPKSGNGSRTEDSVCGESYIGAFDDDQGSATEEEGEGEEEENDTGERRRNGSVDSEEEEEEEYGYDHGESEYDADASFNTVEEHPISKPDATFSFRELHAALGREACTVSASQQPTAPPKPGPFGGGLFSIFTKDQTDADAIRSKFNFSSPAMGLFAPPANSRPTSTPSTLFSPSLLSSALPNGGATTVQLHTESADLSELTSQLRLCLHSKDTSSIDRLISLIGKVAPSERSFPHAKIRTCVQFASLEDVVRLGLRLSCRLPYPLPLPGDSLSHVAVGLLASALARNSAEKTTAEQMDSQTNQAVTCLLVHLGAIKPEKESDDYHFLTSESPTARSLRHTKHLHVTRQVFRTYKSQFSPYVCSCLSLLLSEQQNKENRSDAAPSDNQASKLRDELLTDLEDLLTNVHI
ncbi:unnamed protein product [Dicrocoelium dendriticum]|nr:unnamed protein product [Dicrocoelium dendriticum]